MQKNYYNSLAGALRENDLPNANFVIMAELGKILSENREDFLYLLNNSGIAVNNNMDTDELIDLFIENLQTNKNLMVGSAILVGKSNSTIGFDGVEVTDEDGVKATYKVMKDYYSADGEEYSNAGWIDGIGKIVQTGGDLGKNIIENQRAKKSGATDTLARQKESKAALLQSVIDQKKLQQQAAVDKTALRSKNIKLGLIIGGSILTVTLIIGGIYLIKKHKKS